MSPTFKPATAAGTNDFSQERFLGHGSAMRAGRIGDLYNVLLFILTWGVTCILALAIVPAIHEVGHAAACLTQGNSVTHLQPLPFGAEPDTGCTQITPFVCAAGPLTTAAAWLLCTYSFRRLAVRLTPGHLFTFLSALWLWWSFWAFGEFVLDAIHAYSDVPLHHDTGYFVHLTGINPALASATMFVAIAVLSVPLLRAAAHTLREGGFGG